MVSSKPVAAQIFPIVSTHNTPVTPTQVNCAGYGVVNFGRRLAPVAGQNCTPVNIVLTLLASLLVPMLATGDDEPEIHVYKQASCGCCRPWIKYMESEGFRIQSTDLPEVNSLKREKGIPKEYTSCHTAVVDGYILEGHVSAEDVRRLLKERPAIVGLLVPGMPKGAPGMEGPDAIAYDVLALDKNGAVSVYATHSPRGPDAVPEEAARAAADSAPSPSAEPSAPEPMVEPHDEPSSAGGDR